MKKPLLSKLMTVRLKQEPILYNKFPATMMRNEASLLAGVI